MNELTMLLLVGLAATGLTGSVLAHRRRWAHATGCALLAVLLAWQLLIYTPVIAALLAAAAAGVGWLQWSRSASTVSRWGARARRKSGVASMVDIARKASAAAMRRKTGIVRPSLAELPRTQRWRLRAVEVAVPLCRVGTLRVWSSIEDVACVFGGPRTGKTGYLACCAIDAPGAVLVTSTRTDLHELTAGLRSARGPVRVFNAVGLGGLASTITFDPLTGCTNPVTATERATDLLSAVAGPGTAGSGSSWAGQARRVLAALLHAAALGRLSMRELLGWVSDPDNAHHEVTSLMRRSAEPALAEEAVQFLSTNDRTRTSITSTIMPALGWLASPAAAAAAAPGEGFDVTELLRTNTTVYLLGAEETQAAPLVTALTGHIAREARRIAARRPAGRLDPPLTLVLDEAALISPVPLDSWTADMGGRGVTILAAFQSRAQVIARWGETGAAVILNNTASIMVFGGTRDRDDLNYWSTLAGDRDEPVTSFDDHGRVTSRTVRKVPVLAPAQLANLPAGRVVVFRRGIPRQSAASARRGDAATSAPSNASTRPAPAPCSPAPRPPPATPTGRPAQPRPAHPGRPPPRHPPHPPVRPAAPGRGADPRGATSMTATNGSTGGNGSAPDRRLVALGTALERAMRRVADLETRSRQQDTLLRQLAADVHLLAATTATEAEQPAGPPPVRSWLAAADPDQARVDLAELARWVGAVYARWPDGALPSCWLWHPAVVEELWWLFRAHHRAYHGRGAGWRDVADWHDRHRPGVVKRLRPVLQTCELGRHTHDGDRHDPRPLVPLVDATDQVATAWIPERETPNPTECQLADAEQHDRAQHRTRR